MQSIWDNLAAYSKMKYFSGVIELPVENSWSLVGNNVRLYKRF